MEIAVIGAGPSGIMAALQAAKGRAHVSLFDHNDKIGRKLLVTGSGRCNLSNANLDPQLYTCADPAWMAAFLESFPLKTALQAFGEQGILTHHTEDGWYYPLSDSAHAVVALLEEALQRAGVTLRLATGVSAIEYSHPGFLLNTHSKGRDSFEHFDRLVVAAGGRAYHTLGSRGELFSSLSRLGHTCLPLCPALGPILVSLGSFRVLQGLRFDVRARILQAQALLGETFGNVILTGEGFNGPGVMNLSHLVALHPHQTLTLQLDFLAHFTESFTTRLKSRRMAPFSLLAHLEGFFPPKAALFFANRASLDPQKRLGELTSAERQQLLSGLQDVRFIISGAGNFTNSQITVGGVSVGEVQPHTLQSRLVPGLYLVGETLDVAGPCGGYNLHLAFGSGYLAGKSLAGA